MILRSRAMPNASKQKVPSQGPSSSIRRGGLVGVALTTLLITVWACSDEGHTPDCPPMPIFEHELDSGQPSEADQERLAEWYAEASAQGCATPPTIPLPDDAATD
jgi:hypothetical protein